MVPQIKESKLQNNYPFLKAPQLISEQKWDKLMLPLVSISCITYNHENYIRDAIEGFLKQQTTFKVEILIHDDASTDKTADIIREYENEYPLLINPIYQAENKYSQGVKPSKFNRERAKGKYYAICEGDDYWTDPYKLQKQVDFLEANPEFGMVHTDGDYYYTKTRKLVKNFIINRGRNPNNVDNPFEAILRSDYPIITCSTLTRFSLYNDIDYKDALQFKMGDTFLWLELAKRSKIHFINESMVRWNILIESACHSESYEKLMEFKISGYQLCKYFIAKYGCSNDTEKTVHEKFNRVILNYAFKANNNQEASIAFNNLKRNNSIKLRIEDKLSLIGTNNRLSRLMANFFVLLIKLWKKIFG